MTDCFTTKSYKETITAHEMGSDALKPISVVASETSSTAPEKDVCGTATETALCRLTLISVAALSKTAIAVSA